MRTDETAIAELSSALTRESSEELKNRLASILATTANGLRDMAAIVAELESRGEDLSALRIGMIDHLRRIACGQLLPEVVVRCAGQPRMLQLAIRLTLDDQAKLADGQAFDLAVWRGNAVEWRKVDPLECTSSQLSQIFASDHTRTQQEQVSLLEHRREISLRNPEVKEPTPGKAKVDKKNGTILLNGKSFTPAELLRLIADLSSQYDETAETDTTCIVKLTAEEHRSLKQKCLDGNTTQQMVTRRALRACGLI